MKCRGKLGGWWCGLGLTVAMALPAAAAQHRPPQPPPAPAHPAPAGNAGHNNARNDRPPNAGNAQNVPHNNGNVNGARGATTPPNVQERWRNMTPQERQRVLQNEERLQHSLPLLRSHVPPALLHIRRCRRASRSILISVVVRNILRIARVWRTIVPRVVMPRVPTPGRCGMRWRRMRRLWLRRTVLRRRGRQGHRHGEPEPTPPSTEFAPAFHE